MADIFGPVEKIGLASMASARGHEATALTLLHRAEVEIYGHGITEDEAYDWQTEGDFAEPSGFTEGLGFGLLVSAALWALLGLAAAAVRAAGWVRQ